MAESLQVDAKNLKNKREVILEDTHNKNRKRRNRKMKSAQNAQTSGSRMTLEYFFPLRNLLEKRKRKPGG